MRPARLLALLLISLTACQGAGGTVYARRVMTLDRDDAAGRVVVTSDGRPLLVWHYECDEPLPHWQLYGPSGRPLLEPRPDPYPHHRALWLADRIQLGDGPVVDFYHCWKNLRDPQAPTRGHRHWIKQRTMRRCDLDGGAAHLVAELQWLIDGSSALDDHRTMVVTPQEDGAVLYDLAWTLTARYGPVTFHSDAVHYAWPYLRLDPRLSVQQGGRMVDDRGRSGQAGTHDQAAHWIDCSNTIDGTTEGIALLLPDSERRWLTRDYGCFGPRREAERSGVKFTLARGESISGRVGILVHSGDAVAGRVAEHHAAFAGSAR